MPRRSRSRPSRPQPSLSPPRCCSRPAAAARERRGPAAGPDPDVQQPDPIQSGTFDLDFKIETNGGEAPAPRGEARGSVPEPGPGQFPQFDFDVSLQARRAARRPSRARRPDLHRRRGRSSTSRGPSTRCPSSSTTSSPPPTRSSRARTAPAGRSASCRALSIGPAEVADRPEERGDRGRRGHSRRSTSPVQANVPQLVKDLKSDRQGRRGRGGQRQHRPARPAQRHDPVRGTSTSTRARDDKLAPPAQASLDLKPPPGTPGGAGLARDRLRAQLRGRQQAADDPGAGERPAADRRPPQRLGIDRRQLGGALRGGLGSGGALPQSGGSTKAPSRLGDAGVPAVPLAGPGSAALQQCAALLGQ